MDDRKQLSKLVWYVGECQQNGWLLYLAATFGYFLLYFCTVTVLLYCRIGLSSTLTASRCSIMQYIT